MSKANTIGRESILQRTEVTDGEWQYIFKQISVFRRSFTSEIQPV